jgi:hypothetical protein
MGLGSEIPDPGVKKAPDPGSGYAKLMLNEKGQKLSESHYATSTTKKEGGGH